MVENANHPPIPPGCPYLLDDKGALRFTPPGLFENDPQQMQDWRPIIAAVAEVAWLREAERLREEYVSAFTYNTRPLIVGDLEALRKAREDYALDSRIQGARDATAHARAWREWGEANAEGR